MPAYRLDIMKMHFWGDERWIRCTVQCGLVSVSVAEDDHVRWGDQMRRIGDEIRSAL